MNEISVFNFQNKNVRVVTDDNGEPWFVAKDVCNVLEIKNSRDTLNKCLDADEKGVDTIYTPGGNQTYMLCSVHADDKCITDSVYVIHDNMDEAAANTRLIAAAPEMYEQLKRHCALCMLQHPECECCEICDTGKVLKKARGEEK